MQFVKTSVLKQEFTPQGIKETETETRSDEQLALEARLSSLPEFNRDPQFRSLAEQVHDDSTPSTPLENTTTDTNEPKYPVASVTEEEFEFYESLKAKEKGILLKRKQEDDDIKKEFARAKESLVMEKPSIDYDRHSSATRKKPRSFSSDGFPTENNLFDKNFNLFSCTRQKFSPRTLIKSFAAPHSTLNHTNKNLDLKTKNNSIVEENDTEDNEIQDSLNKESKTNRPILSDLLKEYEDSDTD